MTAAQMRVRDAYLAALILTGTAEEAERAVMDAIATAGCKLEELLVATAKCAIQLRNDYSLGPKRPLSLPPELQRLFLLHPIARKCFVLRVLMGITLEMTSEILNLHKDQVAEELCRAVSDLPRLAGVQNALATTRNQSDR
jgi:hypothetical protein